MKKWILITALIAISLPGQTFAQEYLSKQMSKSKTDLTFNINGVFVSLRDFVVLKQGRMILDLGGPKDYEAFRNLDSILTVFMKDIAFYKDSLSEDPTAHVRIDYVLNEEYSFKKIRFKKYGQDGSIFMNKDGEIAKLKFEQDTVRIIIQTSRPGLGRSKTPCMVPYSVQATFLIGNYTDINRIVAEKVLGKIIDTLEKESQITRRKKDPFDNPRSIIYNPYYSGKGALQKYNWVMKDEYDSGPGLGNKPSNRFFSVNASIGAGVVMNTLAPMADIGIQYNKFWMGNVTHNIFRLSATPYYFFNRNEKGDIVVNDNWFVNADVGSIYNDKVGGNWVGNECTFGVGYLFFEKGGYFKNTTVKVFTDIQIAPGYRLVPEVVVTNNFKQIFPGITLKVF